MRYEVPQNEGWKLAGAPQAVELESIYRGRIALYRKTDRLVVPGLLVDATVKKHFLEEQPEGLTFQALADMHNRVGRIWVTVRTGIEWVRGTWRAGSGVGDCFVALNGGTYHVRAWPPQNGLARFAGHGSTRNVSPLTEVEPLLSALFAGPWSSEEVRAAFTDVMPATQAILAAAGVHGGELGELAMRTFSEEAD